MVEPIFTMDILVILAGVDIAKFVVTKYNFFVTKFKDIIATTKVV